MRSAMTVIISVFFMLLADSASLAQMSGNTLRGFVVTAHSGSPAAVRMRLQRFGMTIQEMSLHENRFEFFNVEEGRYTLVADAAGYKTVIEDINVPGESPVIELHPQRKAVQRAEAVPVWDLKVPESARRQFEAAKSKLREKNCVDALDHLKKAVHTYAEYGDAHKAMGECYAQMNQLEAAEQEFKRALDQPHAPELHLLLGKIYVREDNRALLERQLELYVEEKPIQQRNRR
jgi:tetratricopeptide (TPR) repeat protein